MRKPFVPVIVAVLSLVSYGFVVAQSPPPAKKSPANMAHVTLNPGDMQFGDQPPGLPAGAKVAVLYGNPGKPGLFIIRVKAPDGYKVPPHFHPGTENITVVSGRFHIISGDVLDATKGTALGAGGFMSMPGKMHHAAWTEGETEFEVAAMGPFAITYVNKADDPRLAKK
ncbi:MAG: cupin domain-containing protein [Acidobacteriota bacterium]